MAIQVSAGHLPGAEAGFPPLGRSDINKVTASATYHRTTSERVWATTVAYGLNAGEENVAGIGTFDAVTNALLVESSLTLQERHAWFGRAELVEKPAHDLHAHEWLDRIFTVGKLQAGYVRYTAPRSGIAVGLGGFVSASLVPREIAARYYGRIAPGLGVFVIARPGRQF